MAIFGVGPEWSLAGIGDVNGDGRADIHWRYSAIGRLVTWLMNGGVVQGTAVFGVGAEWDVTGVGDFNGDGTSDLLWRQPASGWMVPWFMSGGNVQSTAVFGAAPGWSRRRVGRHEWRWKDRHSVAAGDNRARHLLVHERRQHPGLRDVRRRDGMGAGRGDAVTRTSR